MKILRDNGCDIENREPSHRGPLFPFLAEDHAKLNELLQCAVNRPGHIDHVYYNAFRAGLLRHIGMEEKVPLPAAQRLGGGKPLAIAGTLRLDHGALASLHATEERERPRDWARRWNHRFVTRTDESQR